MFKKLDEKKVTKKASSKPKAKAKPKAKVFPSNPTRVYGATVFSKTVSKDEAAALISEHGFRLFSVSDAGYYVHADAIAYRSYKGDA
tara:strand:+ start:2757 stop:3017 length:261 start_codon:yes stop_codon:yes gene_type:complete